MSKKRGNFRRKVNGGSSPDANGFDSVGNGTICGESLRVGTSDVNNVRESSVWEELVDKIRPSREELMDIKRRDCMRLRFNELVHMVFTSKEGNVSWQQHGTENASEIEVVQSGGEVRRGVPSAS